MNKLIWLYGQEVPNQETTSGEDVLTGLYNTMEGVTW